MGKTEKEIKTTTDEDYFNYCHNFVSHVNANSYLLKVGLLPYVNSLDIGYDTATKEIILPIDEARYHSIKLVFDKEADQVDAQKVLQHYNLQPYETAKWNLHKDANGKLIDGGNNYDKPYSDDSPLASLNIKIQAKIKERRKRYERYRSRVGFC